MSNQPLFDPLLYGTAFENIDERQALGKCESHMDALALAYPDWYALYDITMPDSASRAEVVELLSTAPNDFALALMYGKYTMRLEIAAITGREFS
ncbi:MAG: hypothetical protein V4731_04010 [Pseudomonadota bacterium]